MACQLKLDYVLIFGDFRLAFCHVMFKNVENFEVELKVHDEDSIPYDTGLCMCWFP